MELKNINNNKEETIKQDNTLDEGAVYIRMALNDIVVFNQDHFFTVRDVIQKHKDLTHIISDIGFIAANIDKEKLFLNKVLERDENTKLDPYVFACVVAKIDREQENVDLMASNVLLQIDAFIKKYVMLH